VLEVWTHEELHRVFQDYLAERQLKPKDVFMPARIAVTGSKETPPLFESMEVIGKDMVTRRLRNAIEFLKAQS